MNVHRMWSETELDEALAALHADVPPGEKALARMRADLMTAAGVAPPAPRRRHYRRWLAAGVAVGVVATAAFALQTIPFGGRPAATASAAEVLNPAADKAASSDPIVRPGQYLLVEKHQWQFGSSGSAPATMRLVRQEQTWVPADRTQEWRTRSVELGAGAARTNPPSGRDGWDEKAKCGEFFGPPPARPCERHGTWGLPTPEFLASLPTDPQQLYTRLRADSDIRGVDPGVSVFRFATGVLGQGLIPADVRANIYRALIRTPGLRVIDQRANLNGRIGTSLGVDVGHERHELVIDPVTSEYIGQRHTEIAGNSHVPAGTVTHYSTTSLKVVDNMG